MLKMAICFACGNLESCNSTVCWRCNPRHRIFKTATSSSNTELSSSAESVLNDSRAWFYNTHVKPNTQTKKSKVTCESDEPDDHQTDNAKVVKTVSKMMEELAIDDEKLANLAQVIMEKLNDLKVAIERSENKSS